MSLKFGQIIGRVSRLVRAEHSLGEDVIFSVKGMTDGELQKIQRYAPEIIGAMQPVLLEIEHSLMLKFFKKPDMTPGDIRDFYASQYEVAIAAVQAELRERGKL